MARRAVTCGETFARNDECGGVWTEVEEKLCHNVEGEKGFARKEVIGETDCDKYAGQKDKAHDLNRFAANGIDCRNCNPISLSFILAGF